jgi:hypothetical protein
MSDDGQSSQQPAGSQLVDGSTARLLKEFGFDPGVPVFEYVRVDFDIEQLKRALFESDYSNPVTLPFLGESADSTTPVDIDLYMVVESVRASYESYEAEVDGVGINRYESPEYYVRGHLYRSGTDRTAVSMHAYLRVSERTQLSGATVQVVLRSSGADPSTPLVYWDSPLGHIGL